MDRKAKKRIEVLRKKLISLHQKLLGAKEQEDEPGEVEAVEKEILDAKAEIEKLKKS